MSARTPYQILGEDGIKALSQTFYDVMDELPQAENIRKMHAENMDMIKQKLAEWLTEWMGGPSHYSEKYGSLCLTDSHKPYPIGSAEQDQWLECMTEALERIGAEDELKAMLKTPFYQVTETLINRKTSEPVEHDPNRISMTNI